jgi:hypothetical protein
MSNVICSIADATVWRTMSNIRGSLSFYKENNQTGKFNNAIERETKLYKEYLKRYVTGDKQDEVVG